MKQKKLKPTNDRGSQRNTSQIGWLAANVERLQSVVGENECSEAYGCRDDDDDEGPDEQEGRDVAKRCHYVLVLAARSRYHAAEFGVGERAKYGHDTANDPNDQRIAN